MYFLTQKQEISEKLKNAKVTIRYNELFSSNDLKRTGKLPFSANRFDSRRLHNRSAKNCHSSVERAFVSFADTSEEMVDHHADDLSIMNRKKSERHKGQMEPYSTLIVDASEELETENK